MRPEVILQRHGVPAMTLWFRAGKGRVGADPAVFWWLTDHLYEVTDRSVPRSFYGLSRLVNGRSVQTVYAVNGVRGPIFPAASDLEAKIALGQSRHGAPALATQFNAAVAAYLRAKGTRAVRERDGEDWG